MVPTLSLETQLSRALDRRTAAHLCRDDLSILADGLIVQAYGQKALIAPCSSPVTNTSSGPGRCWKGWGKGDHATGPTRCTAQ
jgi:hypothetical protein